MWSVNPRRIGGVRDGSYIPCPSPTQHYSKILKISQNALKFHSQKNTGTPSHPACLLSSGTATMTSRFNGLYPAWFLSNTKNLWSIQLSLSSRVITIQSCWVWIPNMFHIGFISFQCPWKNTSTSAKWRLCLWVQDQLQKGHDNMLDTSPTCHSLSFFQPTSTTTNDHS